VAWVIVGGQSLHYNGTAQVFPYTVGGSRFVWTADLLPNELSDSVTAMIGAGIAALKQTMESLRSLTAKK
jgi:hypothetical protein